MSSKHNSSYVISPTVDIRSLVDAAIHEGGASIDQYIDESSCCTLLHLAIQNDLIDCAIHLISAGADINIPNSDGLTPRDVALDNGNQIMLQVISRREECMMQMFNRKKRKKKKQGLLTIPTVLADRWDRTIDYLEEEEDDDGDTKMMPLVLNSCTIYEDYLDWTDYQRRLHLQVSSDVTTASTYLSISIHILMQHGNTQTGFDRVTQEGGSVSTGEGGEPASAQGQ